MSYHQRIMNIPCPTGRDTAFEYVYGHRDARHAAAEIAGEAEAELAMVRADLELMRVERDEARAERDELADAHGKNAHDGAKARGTVGKGHHCAWREVAEAMEQRARAALAVLAKEAEA